MKELLISLNRRQKIAFLLSVSTVVGSVIVTLYIRLANPGMTDTQLLIAFWRQWLVMTIITVSTYIYFLGTL
jgi:hypothetical protein